jgi:hypothetical protein
MIRWQECAANASKRTRGKEDAAGVDARGVTSLDAPALEVRNRVGLYAAASWRPWDRLLRERFQPDQTAETAPEAVYHGAPSFSQIQIKIAQFPVFAAGPSDGDAERDRSYVVALYCVFSAENP